MRFGRLGPVTAWVVGESENEERWRRGAEGEERTGRRFESLFADDPVEVLHDLCVPGTKANIDHITIGPGGLTVIDSKNRRGRLRVRDGELMLGDYPRPDLVAGVRKRMTVVRAVLDDAGIGPVDIQGAVCWVCVRGLPTLSTLTVDGVRIDGPRQIAKLARRDPDGPVDVKAVTDVIGRRLGRMPAFYSGVSANGSSVSRELDTSTQQVGSLVDG